MRIGIIAPPWLPVPPPAYGGTEEVIDNLARGLQDRGTTSGCLRSASPPARCHAIIFTRGGPSRWVMASRRRRMSWPRTRPSPALTSFTITPCWAHCWPATAGSRAHQWPFGLVMVEALAAGTPVLAFANGAAPEIVDDGQTGFLCRDEEKMTAAVSRVPQICRAHCRAAVERRFSAQRMVADHERLYRRILLRPGDLADRLSAAGPGRLSA